MSKVVKATSLEPTPKVLNLHPSHSQVPSSSRIIYTKLSSHSLQIGPTCGLHALHIICPPLSPKTLLDHAQTHAHTLSGELFSIQSLLKIATDFLSSTHSISLVQASSDSITAALIRPQFVVIAYDMDGNFAPCERRGHRAHWCVLHGPYLFCFAFGPFLCAGAGDINWLSIGIIIPPNSSTIPHLDQNELQLQTSGINVIATHGKSVRTNVWPLDELVRSNKNLVEVRPGLCQKKHMIPVFGMDLAGWMLVIEPIRKSMV